MTRREAIAGLAAAVSFGGAGWSVRQALARRRQTKPLVSIVKASSYREDLAGKIRSILREHKVAVQGRRVVLKPNLVEFDPAVSINTHPLLVAAAWEAFHSLGAASVQIAEGPGHRRNTLEMAEAAGYFSSIANFEEIFTDLNLDDVSRVTLERPRSPLRSLYLPNTALAADLLVSMPKMKTHHWVGATLSMKNFFGLVPGAIYGWPKNILHWAGIPECIVDLNSVFANAHNAFAVRSDANAHNAFAVRSDANAHNASAVRSPRSFAIVDGIVGMEGNGPIQGKPKTAGVLVAGSDLVAVDATCCRVMGIDPALVSYLTLAAARGQTEEARVEQIGELVRAVRTNFELILPFRALRWNG